jgi:hypothetical protein
MTSNIINFISYRLDHVKPRHTSWSSAMCIRRVGHLHNLRLKHDLHPLGVRKRTYYPSLPRPRSGLMHRSDTQITMNKLINMIRSEAEPAELIEWRTMVIPDGVDIKTLNDKSN